MVLLDWILENSLSSQPINVYVYWASFGLCGVLIGLTSLVKGSLPFLPLSTFCKSKTVPSQSTNLSSNGAMSLSYVIVKFG